MEQHQQSATNLFTGWRGGLIVLFCLAMLALGCAGMAAAAGRHGLLGSASGGRIGIGEHSAPQFPGWVVIDRVDPGSGAQRAGLRVGDRVHFADPLLLSSAPPPGTFAALTVRHAVHDRVLRVQYLAAPPEKQQFWPVLWFTVLGGGVFALLLGALVLWRGWGSVPALALGLGLVGFAGGDSVPWWMLGSPLTPLGLAAIVASNVCAIGLPLFPPLLYRENVGAIGRNWWIAIATTVGLAGIVQVSQLLAQWLPWSPPIPWRVAEFVIIIIEVAIPCWWSWRGTRDGIGTERSRFAILLFAGSLLFISVIPWLIGLDGLALLGPDAQPVLATVNLLLGLIAFPLALAYAVLRHRVVDLGFALNRTVVYGSVSAILLGSFGLIEWAVERLLPEEWVKASVWIDAGAAVLVYLAFHRVHEAVERRVEQVFFRQWQRNEDNLRRFVASAAHFEDEGALARGFAEELERFAGGAKVALYRREAGVLDRVAGSWDRAPRKFREDNPAFALMRAERAPLDLGLTSTDLPGVLALPMLDHGVLAGLVLLDLKPTGALYRPDEVDLLGQAAHEVGLALTALHAGLIDTENRLLKAQLARLGSIIGDRLDRANA